jgi:hypothetical protein
VLFRSERSRKILREVFQGLLRRHVRGVQRRDRERRREGYRNKDGRWTAHRKKRRKESDIAMRFYLINSKRVRFRPMEKNLLAQNLFNFLYNMCSKHTAIQ